MQMIVLGHEQVVAALEPGPCAEAMEEALAARARGEAYMPLRSVMAPPSAPGFMGLMPGWRGGDGPTFSLKVVCVMPGNPARGLDSHQGIVALFDNETGMPTAILDGSAVTEIRTAAVSAVATRLLARKDASVLAILGAGVQGRAHLRSLTEVREFGSVRLFSRTRRHAEALAAQARALVGAAPRDVTVAATAEEAVRGADVIVTATNSRETVLEQAWLGPGVHVNAVGASVPSMRELEAETVAASALFCDSRESLAAEAGEFQLAVREGLIPGIEHVRAELGEVLTGSAPGRQNDGELTLFRSLGLAIEDLAAAQLTVATARRLGLGTEVKM
jgi:ornithine cyclodeaminase/alanine dehydrogenase-like protein (mu-crystallin family)